MYSNLLLRLFAPELQVLPPGRTPSGLVACRPLLAALGHSELLFIVVRQVLKDTKNNSIPFKSGAAHSTTLPRGDRLFALDGGLDGAPGERSFIGAS